MKRRYIGFLVVLLFSLLCWGITGVALASEEHEIEYTVSFVDTSDYNTKIFNMQRGKVAEGTVASKTCTSPTFADTAASTSLVALVTASGLILTS